MREPSGEFDDLQKRREWKRLNPDKVRAQQQRWRERHREAARAQGRRFRERLGYEIDARRSDAHRSGPL
jgi:hypothetical protein